jgi:hypothetical protein
MRGRSVALRCYDKGKESETCTPGMWLRLERQRRWRKEQEHSGALLNFVVSVSR